METPELYVWGKIDELPEKPGLYIIETESSFIKSKHRFEARFNGKHFDITNQVFKRYLKPYVPSN